MNHSLISQAVSILSDCLTMPLLYVIRYHFYKNLLGFKKNIRTYIVFSVFLFAYSLYISKLNSNILELVLDYVVLFFIVNFLCKGNLIMKLYSITVEYAVLALTSFTFLPISLWYGSIIKNVSMSFTQYMIMNFIYLTISSIINYIILYVDLSKIWRFLNIKDKQLSLSQSLCLLLPCLSSFGLISVFYFIQILKKDNKLYLRDIIPKHYYIILSFISFLFLVSLPIMAYTFKKMIESEEEKQKNIIIDKQFVSYINHMKNVDRIYLGIRKVIHDMNNHISCLRNLADNNNIIEIKEYLHNLSDTISKLDFRIKTGNPICDAVINEKFNISKNENIEFICDFMIPKNISIESIDLCIILGNSLDNSIEACRKITDNSMHKTISLKSFMREFYLIIEISNSIMESPKYIDNNIISSKRDKIHHGLGLKNINDVVKKYNGAIDILKDKDTFTLTIMLKIN